MNNLKSLFIDWGNQFLIHTDWIIENKLKSARSYAGFLNIYQTERDWIVFRGMSYPKLGKITVTCPK